MHDSFDDNANNDDSGVKLPSTSSNGSFPCNDFMSRLCGRDASSHTPLIQTKLNGHHAS